MEAGCPWAGRLLVAVVVCRLWDMVGGCRLWVVLVVGRPSVARVVCLWALPAVCREVVVS